MPPPLPPLQSDDAADAAFSAARAGNPGAYAAGDSAYDSVYSVLEMDASAVDNGQGTAVILASKLWPDGDPRECTRLWNALKRDLLSEGPDWHVWTDWYDARLTGKGSKEKLEVARLTISDEIWEQRPAIVNAEIKRLIANYARRPRKKSNPKPATGVPPDLPAPIENVPSALSFGWSSKGTITVVTGAQNWPVFPFQGGDRDHANRLEACRVVATDMARSLRSGRWNARSDYAETLDQYAAYLPAQSGEGNFLLADAEARIIRSMFAAEQDFLPAPLAARLKVLLEQHIGLRAYYPATEDFYESVRSGQLERPLPLDAVEGFIHGVRENTPTLFEPNVSQSLEGVAQPIPKISTANAEAPKADSAQPAPPPDPLGEVDPEKSRRFTLGSAVNTLWKAVLSGEKAGKTVEGWSTVVATLGPNVLPILEYLRSVL